MSKSTIAVIAAVSAGTGAAVTAAMYSLRSGSGSGSGPSSTKPAATPTTYSVPAPSPAAPPVVPAQKVFAPAPAPPAPTPAPAPTPYSSPASSTAPVDPAGLFQYGFPGPVADLASRTALVSSYDRRLRNPHWVAEHITPASLAMRDGDRGHSQFIEDQGVPEIFRAKLKDYFRSGFDRGHQVPAADCKWSQTAMDETFFLSNMCPQVGEGFNRDYWAHFEDFVRRLTQRYPSVRVVTGPLYLPKRDPADNKWYVKYEMIGNPPNVAVPTHFYKVIFAETSADKNNTAAPVALGAFVLPNAPIPNSKPLTDFEVPLEAVERASGLEFASKLPVQRRRRLCTDAACSLIIKDYGDKQKQAKRAQN